MRLGTTRLFRAALVNAIAHSSNDPASISALDCLAKSFTSIESMLNLLWNNPRALEFGYQSALGIEYDPMKQSAVLLLTGRSWQEWQKLEEAA